MSLRARRRGRWHCNVEIKCKTFTVFPFVVKHGDIFHFSKAPGPFPPFQEKKPVSKSDLLNLKATENIHDIVNVLLSDNDFYFQINFFQDHTKIILCPLMQAVTYIDEKRDFRIFKYSLIEKFGCNRELSSRLRYAKTMVERLMTTKSGSGRVRSGAQSAQQ